MDAVLESNYDLAVVDEEHAISENWNVSRAFDLVLKKKDDERK